MAGLRVFNFLLLSLSACALADNSSYISAGETEFTEHFSIDDEWLKEELLNIQLKQSSFQPLFDLGCDFDLELHYSQEGHTSIFRTRAQRWEDLQPDQFGLGFNPAATHTLMLSYEIVSDSCNKNRQFKRRYNLDFNIDKSLVARKATMTSSNHEDASKHVR